MSAHVTGIVELDVTPKWWAPKNGREMGVMAAVLREFLSAWANECGRFGRDLRATYDYPNWCGPHWDEGRVVIAVKSDRADATRPLCGAVLDRLSGHEVSRKVSDRMALHFGDYPWKRVQTPCYLVRIKSVPGVGEVLAQWSYHRMVFENEASVLRHLTTGLPSPIHQCK